MYSPQCLAQWEVNKSAEGIIISVFDFTSVLNVLASPTLLAPVFYLIKKQGPLTLGALRPLTVGAPAPVNRSPQPRTTSRVPGLPGPAADPPTPRLPPPGFQARRYAETPGLDPLLRVIRMDRGPENRSG